MALPWFKVTSALVHHPKLAALERLLPIDPLGVVVRLWAWTAAYAPDGEVPSSRIEHAAAAAIGGATQEDDVTVTGAVTALLESGLIDASGDGYKIHDWDVEQGSHVQAAENNRKRQREFRRRNAKVTVTGNVTVTPQSRVEEKRVDKKEEGSRAASAAALPSLTELESDWTPDLLARVRGAITSTRKGGTMAEGPWRAFLLSARQYPKARRESAAGEYLDRALAGEGKAERYLLAMMRHGAGMPPPARQQQLPAAPAVRTTPGTAATNRLLAEADAKAEAVAAERRARAGQV